MDNVVTKEYKTVRMILVEAPPMSSRRERARSAAHTSSPPPIKAAGKSLAHEIVEPEHTIPDGYGHGYYDCRQNREPDKHRPDNGQDFVEGVLSLHR